MDQDLNDDMNKLVRYSIVCVDRENETVLQSMHETLVKERMDASGFVAWKMLEFASKMAKGRVKLPDDWADGNRPDSVIVEDKGGTPYLTGFKGGDIMKYLRVAFQVVDRYPVERFKYEEKQIDVLKKIEGKIGSGGGPTIEIPKPGQKISIEIEGK